MKISNSKKELARIISENGGWRYGADTCSCDQDGYVNFFVGNPTRSGVLWLDNGDCEYIGGTITQKYGKIKNWHQTILSRDDYFHLYPAPDADGWIEWSGGECPVERGVMVDIKDDDGYEWIGVKALDCIECHRDFWVHASADSENNIISYRPHKPEQADPEFCESVMRSIPELEAKPTIEQLAADYRNAKDYADRKQQEADDAMADADEKLKALELAGEALGLLVSPITEKQEPELVITDWRDLQAGDVISVSGKWWEPDSEYTVDENDGSRDAPISVGGYWALIGECSFKFISRP